MLNSKTSIHLAIFVYFVGSLYSGTAPFFSSVNDGGTSNFTLELAKTEPRAFLLRAEEAADPIAPAVADRAEALARLEIFVAAWREAPEPGTVNRSATAHARKNLKEGMRLDFFSWRRLYRTAWTLEQAEALPADLRAGLREIALDALSPQERGTNNRSYHFALGALYAAKLFPDAPEAPRWRAYAEAVWRDFWKKGDGYEPGYVGHHLPTIIELGEQLGHDEELAGERALLTWRRFADHVSASGRVVQPGDPGGPGDQSDYVEGLAEAARVTRDGVVLGAARRALAAMPPAKSPPPINTADPARLARMVAEATHELAARGVAPTEPEARAQIQAVYPATLREPERAVLTLPGGAGAPYASFWLHDRAETLFHSHEDQRGTLLHYEAGGARLLGGSTWTKWPGGANVFVVAPSTCEFPVMLTRGLPLGAWLPASADIRGLRYFQEGGGWSRSADAPAEQGQRALLAPDGLGYAWANPESFFGAGDKIRPRTATLRVVAIPAAEMAAAVKRRDHQLNGLSFDAGLFWYRDYRSVQSLTGPLELRLTAPTLAGPAGRRALVDTSGLPAGLVLTHHAAGAGRGAGRIVPAAETPEFIRVERTERGPVWRVTCPPGRLDMTWPLDGAEIDLMAGHPRVEFDYAIMAAPGGEPVLRAPLTLAVDGLRPRGLYVEGQQGGRLTASDANLEAGDAGASFTYADCWAAGAVWTRRAVLTGEGALVVLDEYAAAESQGELRAGAVWQLGAEPRRGEDWFVAPARDGSAGAAVRLTMLSAEPLALGVQRQEKFQRELTFAASGSVTTRAGGPTVRILSVLEPWVSKRDGAEAPARAEFAGTDEVRVRLARGTAVMFTRDGRWRVERSGDAAAR
jgi:hypothetical protein